MIVRAWEEKDIAAIADIENKSFADPWTEGMLLDTLRFPVYHTFLAEDGGQVCGYGCLILLFEDAELAKKLDDKRRADAEIVLQKDAAVAAEYNH